MSKLTEKFKICKIHGLVKFILEGRGYYRCVKCRSNHVSKSRKNKKKQLVELYGGKCIKCGYCACTDALVFHHRDPSTKLFGLSSKGLTRSMSELIQEADKCDLLCANCHAEIHSIA